mmetsp:Transcript_9498/g.7917  ORF Transcript_9498/g.7917 Transcript_9498/m.7917 type:complete len:168 (-) Transcript_9498:3-506(-)
MIQGGDPEGTGRGGRSAFKDGEPFRDEFDSRLTHTGAGVVSMANSGRDTNRSQFFITFKSCEHLNNHHTIFGKVVGGGAVLDALNETETDKKERPIEPIRIVKTQVFVNPFETILDEEAAQKKEEEDKVKEGQLLKDSMDVMKDHPKRDSTGIGKYLSSAHKRKSQR